MASSTGFIGGSSFSSVFDSEVFGFEVLLELLFLRLLDELPPLLGAFTVILTPVLALESGSKSYDKISSDLNETLAVPALMALKVILPLIDEVPGPAYKAIFPFPSLFHVSDTYCKIFES